MGLAIPIGDHRFRAASNTENVFSHLPAEYEVDKVLNGGTFKISIRQATTYQKGCAFLAGDAAHVHSPAGGRGMNLGIDDAVELAKRIANGTLDGYSSARRPKGRQAIELSEKLVRMVSLRSPLKKKLRNIMLGILTRVPFLQKGMLKELAGLN
jgi:2-polyprenyl-6-methoxyphenol hydroxylase-like FAD-dependent oxidoreductase